MRKAIKPTAQPSKKKKQGNLVHPDEDIHDKISVKEQRRRELKKSASLARFKAEQEQSHGKLVINGREIDYLNETGANGSTWRVYGKAPHFSEGCLIYHSSDNWEIRFNYLKVVSDKLHSRRSKEKKSNSSEGKRIAIATILSDLETLHYALCDTGKKRVARSAIAPARKSITSAIDTAVKELTGDTLRKMADALDALVRIRDRNLIGEGFIHSILAVAKEKNRIPFKGEVQKRYEDEHDDVLNSSRVSQIFTEIGFDWLPKGKSGPSPKTQGRSVRQAR
jgi:hypothetical protein